MNPKSKSELESLKMEIFAAVEEKGYFHVSSPLENGEYIQIVHLFGTPLSQVNVALGEGERTFLTSPGVVPFHTDSIETDLISWQCNEPAVKGGEILLLDARNILNSFEADELSLLSRVNSGPYYAGRTEPYLASMLRKRHGKLEMFYTPWNVHGLDSPEINSVFEKFKKCLYETALARTIRIRLEKGECLFIDNRRILHGRGEIPADSPRSLTRFLITKHGDTGAIELLQPFS